MSLLYVLVVPDATALTKIAWSFYYGGESGLARLPPASVGSDSPQRGEHVRAPYRLRRKLLLWRYWPVVSV
jgi:hypothetical protein